MDILKILERNTGLFKDDIYRYDNQLTEEIKRNRFLILGGGGSIGQAVSKEIFKRGAECLHVVDLNENYLVELVRDLRSEFGYSTSDFDTYALDVGSDSFEKFIQIGKYDYVLNLSAMKHVRSENSAFSMKRMIKTNLLNVLKTFDACAVSGVKKYFCVSTDKATNPANFMGATKRAMELALMRDGIAIPVSGARFANVAFSNGSLLEGFKERVEKMQPLSLPIDIERFFITQQEAGIICLFSTILGSENQIFFPHNEEEVKLTSFKTVAENYLKSIGKQMIKCYNENDARDFIKSGDLECYWPVNLFKTDTAGEKAFEEFYSSEEEIEYGEFKDLATIRLKPQKTKLDVDNFLAEISAVDVTSKYARSTYINIFTEFVDTFDHINSEKFLNSRM